MRPRHSPRIPVVRPLARAAGLLCLPVLTGCNTAQNALHGLHDDLRLAAAALDHFGDTLPRADRPRHPHRPRVVNTALHPSLFRRPPQASAAEQAAWQVQAVHLGH